MSEGPRRRLGLIMTAAAKRAEALRGTWEPSDDGSMTIAIKSTKGEKHVRACLLEKFKRVSIWFIYGVAGSADAREYIYKCWS